MSCERKMKEKRKKTKDKTNRAKQENKKEIK
jgi:hypothetical protein